MATRHIQIGIDLGTTNSEIAINNGNSIEVIKNDLDDEYTPSVFGVNRSKIRIVGKKAYDQLFRFASKDELVNNKAEVKRIMGTSETVRFERTGEDLKAEEISAEILKSLKESVLKKYPDYSTAAAVITIPAHFSVVQAEATKRAGNHFRYRCFQEPDPAGFEDYAAKSRHQRPRREAQKNSRPDRSRCPKWTFRSGIADY